MTKRSRRLECDDWYSVVAAIEGYKEFLSAHHQRRRIGSRDLASENEEFHRAEARVDTLGSESDVKLANQIIDYLCGIEYDSFGM